MYLIFDTIINNYLLTYLLTPEPVILPRTSIGRSANDFSFIAFFHGGDGLVAVNGGFPYFSSPESKIRLSRRPWIRVTVCPCMHA